MSLKEQLNKDLHAGLRAGDVTRKGALRMLLAAVHNAEIEAGKPLDDAAILQVIGREARQRRESIEEFRKHGRAELAAKEEAELAVVRSYLPAQLSGAEIEAVVRRVIESVGARGLSDKGKVMHAIMAELRGRADGSVVNAVVTQQLANVS